MSQKTIVLIVVLFVVLIVGMFSYAYLKKQELQSTSPEVPVEQTEPVLYPEIEIITAKHYFIDGTHTLVGDIPFPTPCDLLDTSAVVMESFPEQVLVQFSVINNSDTCIQQLTDQRFKVEVQAAQDATFSAEFTGRRVQLNLVPAAEGELPEDFELFIKG